VGAYSGHVRDEQRFTGSGMARPHEHRCHRCRPALASAGPAPPAAAPVPLTGRVLVIRIPHQAASEEGQLRSQEARPNQRRRPLAVQAQSEDESLAVGSVPRTPRIQVSEPVATSRFRSRQRVARPGYFEPSTAHSEPRNRSGSRMVARLICVRTAANECPVHAPGHTPRATVDAVQRLGRAATRRVTSRAQARLLAHT
jgi:hypothetical protein